MSLLTFFSSVILSFLFPLKLKWRPQHFCLTGTTISEAVLPLLLFPCLVLCTQASQNQYFQQASILHAVLKSAVVKHPGNNQVKYHQMPCKTNPTCKIVRFSWRLIYVCYFSIVQSLCWHCWDDTSEICKIPSLRKNSQVDAASFSKTCMKFRLP